MNATSRRDLLTTVVAGGVLAGGARAFAQQNHNQEHAPGPLSHAVVAFGEWKTPVDRFQPTTPANIGHHVSPLEVTIAVNGTVSFLIGGFHLLLIYNDGVRYEDIDATKIIPGPPVPLIDDPTNRLYRGLDPRVNSVDRIENVHFHEPGTYLAVCGVLPHFLDQMYGFVKVVGR